MIRATLLALVLGSTPALAAKPIVKLQLNPAAAKKAAGAVEINVLPLSIVPPGFLNNKPPFDEGDFPLGELVPAPKGPAPVLSGGAMALLPELVKIPMAQSGKLDLRLKEIFDGANARRERDLVPAE